MRKEVRERLEFAKKHGGYREIGELFGVAWLVNHTIKFISVGTYGNAICWEIGPFCFVY